MQYLRFRCGEARDGRSIQLTIGLRGRTSIGINGTRFVLVPVWTFYRYRGSRLFSRAQLLKKSFIVYRLYVVRYGYRNYIQNASPRSPNKRVP